MSTKTGMGPPSAWTNTTHTLLLPAAVRADGCNIRLSTTTGGASSEAGISGSSAGSQIATGVYLSFLFTVTSADTVTVQIRDGMIPVVNPDIQLGSDGLGYSSSFSYIRLH